MIEINREYIKTVSNYGFDSLPSDILHKLFTKGTVVSHFLEELLPFWFPELKFVNGAGYDHIHNDGTLYEMKCFTRGGAKWAPSNMVGKGRKIDKEKMYDNARDKIYVFANVTEFPNIRLVFKSGINMITKHPSGSISKSRWLELING